MDADPGAPTPDETMSPATGPEPVPPERMASPTGPEPPPLTVGDGSQVIAVTINLNLPIFGSVVYASRRAIPAGVGGRIFDVVRRVVGAAAPEGPGETVGPSNVEEGPSETDPTEPLARPVP